MDPAEFAPSGRNPVRTDDDRTGGGTHANLDALVREWTKPRDAYQAMFALQNAGVPAGVFSVLPGGADTGAALVEDPEIDMISFTGSTRGGRIVAELAGRNLKRLHLELGGKNALIVLDDVDL